MPETNLELFDWIDDCYTDQTQGRTFFITGGIGSGKTRSAVQWDILRCFDNKHSRLSWAIAPNHVKVDSILIEAFIECLANDFDLREPKHYKISGNRPRELRFKIINHTIKFQSARLWKGFVGDNISHFLATEAAFYEEGWFNKVWDRVRDPKALFHQGLVEGCPEGFNYFETLANFNDIDLNRNFVRKIVQTGQNPYLKPNYLPSLRKRWENQQQKLESYEKGLFVPFTKGNAYHEYFESRNVVLDVQKSKHLDLLLTWDFQRAPLSWVCLQYQPISARYPDRKRFVGLGEATGKARGLMNACIEFAVQFDPAIFGNTHIKLFGGHDGHHLDMRADDGSSFTVIKRFLHTLGFKRVTIEAMESAPLIKDRLELTNNLFSYELFVLAAWLKNTRHAFMNTETVPGSFKIKKDKNAEKDPSHFSDAADYCLYQLAAAIDLENPKEKRLHSIITQV